MREHSHALRSALTHCLGALRDAGTGRVAVTLALMLGVSATEWVGLTLLVPLLGLVGLDVNAGSVSRLGAAALRILSAVGLPPTLPAVLAGYVGVVAARGILQYLDARSVSALELALSVRLRDQVYRAVSRTDWATFVRLRSAAVVHVLTDEIDRASLLTGQLLRVALQALLAATYLAVALTVSAPLTVFVLAPGIVLLAALAPLRRSVESSGEQVTSATSTFLAAVTEHLGAMKLARSYAAVTRNAVIFSNAGRRMAEANALTQRRYAAAAAWFMVGSAALLGVTVLVAVRGLHLLPSAVLMLLFLFARLVPQLATVEQSWHYVLHALPALGSIADLLERCATSPGEAAAAPSGENFPAGIRQAIEVRGVRYAYPGDEEARPALADVSLTIWAGRLTAIVGPSGAGKTTLADVLLGLLRPDSGGVLVDGAPLGAESADRWRERIGYVPQDSFFFNETVRANLLWAHPAATEPDLWNALRHAGADELVRGLPGGLDTAAGDRGVLLSGGERQRFALARALLRKPALLILDEATSALDTESERRIIQALEQLRGEMTIVMITHRLSAVRSADLIHVLEGGRVAESGGWDELVGRQGGRLRALASAQSLGSSPPSALRLGFRGTA